MINWYTADTHFGHENIIMHSGRPFRSANHMDAILLENLASRVGPEDALWIVGDFAFGPKAKDRKWLENLFARLPGAEQHLVVGNHDGEATQALPWSSVTSLTEVSDGSGAPSVLCHYPPGRDADGVVLWLRWELDAALAELPTIGGRVWSEVNSCDEALGCT